MIKRKSTNHIKDKTGKVYGDLTVLCLDKVMKKGKCYRTFWKCQCSCGDIVSKRSDALNDASSCGCRTKELLIQNSGVKLDIAGQKFHRLTAIKPTDKRDVSGSVIWEFLCECGKTHYTSCSRVKIGMTKSCGCLGKERIAEQGRKNVGKNNGMYGKLREQHPNWKGGRTEYDIIRKSCEYKKWRRQVFERDSFTCTKCGKVGHKLNAHHIVTFKNEETRFNLDNGITLCKDCHIEFHSTYGVNRFKEDDTKKFVHWEKDTLGSYTEIVKYK